jgi:ferredoxin
MPKVVFQDQSKAGAFPAGETLLRCAEAIGVRISHICGGDGICGTCRVEVLHGWSSLSAMTPDETSKFLEPPYRLSCQAKLGGDVVVKVAHIE